MSDIDIEIIISELRAWSTGTKGGSAPLYKPTAKRLLAYIELLEDRVRHPFGPQTIPTAAAQPPLANSYVTVQTGTDPVVNLRESAPVPPQDRGRNND